MSASRHLAFCLVSGLLQGRYVWNKRKHGKFTERIPCFLTNQRGAINEKYNCEGSQEASQTGIGEEVQLGLGAVKVKLGMLVNAGVM